MWGHYILSKAANGSKAFQGRSLRTGVLITPLTGILAGWRGTGRTTGQSRTGKPRGQRMGRQGAVNGNKILVQRCINIVVMSA